MKIISWNVNGLRAVHRKEVFLDFVKKENPDILCLQETKASSEQLPEDLKNIPGYTPYFSSSKHKKGYSGVAIYSKKSPKKVLYSLGETRFDDEGRMIEAQFNDFTLFNVYFPNGGMGRHRIDFKLEFYDAFLKHVEKSTAPKKKIIFCGDVNTAHEEIDLARPKENEKSTGFLPEERAWIDEVISRGYEDVFRFFYPEKKDSYTYWDMKTRARDRNVGWRIDYFFASANMIPRLQSISHLTRVFGSDHCPVALEIKEG